MIPNLTDGIVRILKTDNRTAGTGFVIRDDGLIATCAHVVIDAKAGPGGTVSLVFLASKAKEIRTAVVEAEYWRDPDQGEDIAILRLEGNLSKEVVPLPLGSSVHSGDHNFSTYGFPELDSLEGMRGGGKVLGTKPQEGFSVLQLRSEEVTQGFSGAPVWDTTSQVVIGMVTRSMENREVKIESLKFTQPFEPNWRFLYAAFATPTEALREVYPELQVSSECPYRQLVAFTEADARFFYGRDIFIDTLLKRLHDSPRFLAVFGPSGSGKSSVIRAGLIPDLREGALLGSDKWEINIIRPTDDPFRLLVETSPVNSDNLTQKAGMWLEQHPEPTNRFVLVVDQFEELLASKDLEPSTFITELATLHDRSPQVTLIIVMRNDFYSQFTEYSILRKWLEESKGAVNIPQTLTRSELEAIIREPAKRANIHIQDGLVDLLIRDAIGEKQQEGQSTVLPLLEFALTQLWEKRQDETLTLDIYNEMHGIKDAFTSWANITYDNLVEKQLPKELPLEYRRHLVQRIITDLVHIGDENRKLPNSRQPKSLVSLCYDESELRLVQQSVSQLVNARLLVQDEGMVEIIHDVLLNEWGYLKNWVKADREFLIWRQDLEKLVQAWIKTNRDVPAKRDKGRLLGRSALDEAIQWFEDRRTDLSQPEQSFIKASRTWRSQRRFLSLTLGGIVTAATVGGVTLARFLGTTTSNPQPLLTYSGHSDHVNTVAWSHDGQRIASGSDDHTVQVWNAADGSRISIYHGHRDGVNAVAWSPDGKRLASASDDNTAQVWDATGKTLFVYRQHKGNVRDVAWSHDGRRIASASYDGTVQIWDAVTGERFLTYKGHTDWVFGVAWSPDGKLIASSSRDGTAQVWNPTDPAAAAQGHYIYKYNGHNPSFTVKHVAWSPDSRRVASASYDQTAQVWDATTGHHRTIYHKHVSAVLNVAWSPNGQYIASASADFTMQVWRDGNADTLRIYAGHTDTVNAVAWSPDGKFLVTASDDKKVKTWQAP